MVALQQTTRTEVIEYAAVHESGPVKVFGCRPLTNGSAGTEGRRPKTSKGGNRAEGRWADAASAMGI